jgi:hypothetical protein
MRSVRIEFSRLVLKTYHCVIYLDARTFGGKASRTGVVEIGIQRPQVPTSTAFGEQYDVMTSEFESGIGIGIRSSCGSSFGNENFPRRE